jgi:hypothetical protein
LTVATNHSTGLDADLRANADSRDPETTACVALWCDVIKLAFLDAIGTDRWSMGATPTCWAKEIDQARVWLTANSDEFRAICDAAGVHPDAILRRARAMQRAGWASNDKIG